MADGKIYITISDERNGNGGIGSNGSNDTPTTKTTPFNQYIQQQFNDLIKTQSQQVVNAALGNVGFLTGNYIAQRKINETISIANSLRTIGLMAYGGFKVSGTVAGAAVGGAFALVSLATSVIISDTKAHIEVNRTNQQIDRLRDISGLNNLTNGSR